MRMTGSIRGDHANNIKHTTATPTEPDIRIDYRFTLIRGHRKRRLRLKATKTQCATIEAAKRCRGGCVVDVRTW